jgi:uncharacterized caspase-like protein
MTWTRRRLLQGGLATGSLLMLPRWGRAQPAPPGLPKVALVLGNGRYKDAPLKNPANDAKAIGAALSATGFAVTLKTDVGRAELAAAVQAYVAELAKRKPIGLFYYAGHGIQLAWRNYMLPVDAEIESIADIQKQGVEVNALLEGLGRAANAMNVIILDACRDNPFGNLKGVDAKGLSQMDAPRNTLLAYATSPGNVASDGAGANGLYTENLLREIAVRETKIEDVFKRVRLGVRRESNGTQVPWESTSLEEDFYFIPPSRPRELAEAEKSRRFDEELQLWEKVHAAADPALLEEYLRRHPSGRFAELAQLQLDRVLARRGERRIRIASADGNPFTKGSASANTGWRVGDSYTYRVLDRVTSTEDTQVFAVTDVTETEVKFRNGQVVDLLGNILRRPGGRVYSPNQLEPVDYAVGKQWRTEFRISTPRGTEGQTEMDLKIAARESITVPAGTFNAFRIEGRGVFNDPAHRHAEETLLRKWVAPDRLRFPVALEETRQRGGGKRGRVTQSRRLELAAFKES